MRFRHGLSVILGLTGIAGIVFRQALFTTPDRILAGYDITHYYFFMKSYLKYALLHGFIPWWNPYTFSGMPFVENPQNSSILYLPNLLFVFLPLTTAFTWYLFLHILLAMIGMYMLVRLFAGRVASFAAACAFGLSGYFMARIYVGHVDMVAASAWAPLVMRYFWQAMVRQNSKKIIRASFVYALQIMAGYPTVALFMAEFLGITAVVVSVGKRSPKPLFAVFIAGAIGVALAAFQVLPNQVNMRLSTRSFTLPYDWTTIGAYEPWNMKELLIPSYVTDRTGPVLGYPERAAYIGFLSAVIIITVSITAILGRYRRLEIWVFMLPLVFGIWVSAAQYAPVDIFHVLWKYIPMYGQLRLPPRHMFFTVVAGSVLTGIGLNMMKNRLIRVICAILIIGDMALFAQGYVQTVPSPEVTHNREVFSILSHGGSRYRFIPLLHQMNPPESFPLDAPVMYRIYSVNGIESGMLRRYYEFMDAVNGMSAPDFYTYDSQVPYTNFNSRLIDFLNVKYVIVPSSADAVASFAGDRYKQISTADSQDIRIYESSTALPRFNIVPSAAVFDSKGAMLNAISSGLYDPGNTVLLDQSEVDSERMRPDCTKAYPVINVLDFSPNTIQLETDAPCTGFLVTSEVMYPGWQAKIDGKKTSILTGNYAFRTVFLPKGKHVVEFKYIPVWYLAGLAISVLTCASCLLWIKKQKT